MSGSRWCPASVREGGIVHSHKMFKSREVTIKTITYFIGCCPSAGRLWGRRIDKWDQRSKIPPLTRSRSRPNVRKELTSICDEPNLGVFSFENKKGVTKMSRVHSFMNDPES
jgi:hypothetical protein